jgi:arylsulfatase A-like enzyme
MKTEASTPPQPARKPNNLGMGELSVYNGGPLRGTTSRIDAFAGQGMRLLNFAPETQCTPTRSALMTGRHSHSFGQSNSCSGWFTWRACEVETNLGGHLLRGRLCDRNRR